MIKNFKLLMTLTQLNNQVNIIFNFTNVCLLIYYLSIVLNMKINDIAGITGTNNKFEEARKKREERKLARQRQMEAKRAAKLRSTAPAKKV